ncbi:hypothetical protein LshimejAT787_0702060 [Lyophyllum shimeji]|uniref:G domain-containing protein n=1 Tax=Lyophyllum shimeji TaxID=47721 RepID=A0A9P3PQ29_LYOSH|nr:hypothetical protein LshimejAT787_0702060 [Lyophyllum shimeji]
MNGFESAPSDSFVGKTTDIVLFVMGLTGVGKSTFINKLFGQDVAEVNHDTNSKKPPIQYYCLPHPEDQNRRLVIVDTPGFEESPEGDLEIVRRIAGWLATSYNGNYALAGGIFLHEIQQTRIRRATSEYVNVLNELCGIDITKSLILVTNKWSEAVLGKAERNEKRLGEEHWSGLLQRGAQMSRFEDTQSSAYAIVNRIVKPEAISPAQVPRSVPSISPTNVCITKDSGIMILILGDTGVGKSTFINTAAGQPIAEVNHDLTPSCDLIVRRFDIRHPQHSTPCIFVDTPGFDNYDVRDHVILGHIINWLKISCRSDASFGGIVYLHDITKPRTQSTIGSFSLMGLSRPEPAGHVLMTTVKWEKAKKDPYAESREQELKNHTWRRILDGGAKTCRFENTSVSAWSIIDTLLQTRPLELDVIWQSLDTIYRFMPKTPAKRKGLRGFFAALFNRGRPM